MDTYEIMTDTELEQRLNDWPGPAVEPLPRSSDIDAPHINEYKALVAEAQARNLDVVIRVKLAAT